MIKFSYFIFFGLALLLTSCANQFEKEIKEVENLQQILQTVKQSYQTIEVEKVSFAKDTYVKNMEQLENFVPIDSITLNTANLIKFYKGVEISANGFEEDYNMIGEKIVFVENQLKTLKLDLENNLDIKDSVSLFINDEKGNIETLQNNIGIMLYNYDFILSTHDSITTKIQNIILKNVE